MFFLDFLTGAAIATSSAVPENVPMASAHGRNSSLLKWLYRAGQADRISGDQTLF
jgi:hypothetical protein